MSDLDAAAVARALARLGVIAPATVLARTASTNDDARAAAASGAPSGASVIADAQSSGRGRGGHTWHSPPGENVYLSVVARPRVPAARVAPFALAVGVAVARVAESLLAGRAPVWIKWPNDVLAGAPVDGGLPRKLAGVLIEGQLRGADVTGVIAGVGINVHAAAFPEELASRATSLALLGVGARDRAAIAAAIVAGIAAAAERYEIDGLASFHADLIRLDALRGRLATVSGVRGEASGIDAEGRLLLRTATGIVPVVTGEVAIG